MAIHIKIGDVQTMEVKNWQVIPDDRQTKIETIGGIAIQDFGHVEEGDSYSCEVTLHKQDWLTVKGYWHNRTLVNIIDEGEEVHQNMRVIVKKYSYLDGFKKYVKATLELWRA